MNMLIPAAKTACTCLSDWYKHQDEVRQMIFRHSCINSACAMVTVPYAGEAAAFVNQIVMYRNINKLVGIRFSDRLLRNIGKFILSQGAGMAGGALALVGLLSTAKFVPGVNVLCAAIEVPICGIANYICGAVYYRMVGKSIQRGITADSDEESILQAMKAALPSAHEIKEIREEAKAMMKGAPHA